MHYVMAVPMNQHDITPAPHHSVPKEEWTSSSPRWTGAPDVHTLLAPAPKVRALRLGQERINGPPETGKH